MNFGAMLAGAAIGIMPRRWRRWVLSTIATVVIVLVSFFVDALNTPSDPTIEQYTGHSGRTSLLMALGAVWVLGTLVLTIASSIASRTHYVAFPEPPAGEQVIEATVHEAPAWGSNDEWIAEEWAHYHGQQRAAAIRRYHDRMDAQILAAAPEPEEDPDAEYKILREAADKLDALRGRS